MALGADNTDKTEPATGKRRSEARKRGQVMKSSELSSIGTLLILLLALKPIGSAASRIVTLYFEAIYSHLGQETLTTKTVMKEGRDALLTLGRALAPLVLLEMISGFLVNYAQVGNVWATERLKPDLNRINPLNGLGRFFSPASLVELVKSVMKIGLISLIAWTTINNAFPQLLMLSRMDISQALTILMDLLYRMTLRIVFAMLVMAAMDYGYQRYSYEKSLKMSKQEVKDEHKQAEGDPRTKSRVRARQREIAKKRMMAEVPTADVVITNPTHFAVALKYETGQMGAPIVVAKGQDLLAQKIREIAQGNDIPLVENPPLARALYKQVNIGQEIPADLYEAVAEVLAFVYQVNQKRRERAGFGASVR